MPCRVRLVRRRRAHCQGVIAEDRRLEPLSVWSCTCQILQLLTRKLRKADYVELHVPDITTIDLDAQESGLEGKGYLLITLTCQLMCNLKGLLSAELQAGRPRVFNSYHAL